MPCSAVIAVQKSNDGSTEEARFIFRSYGLDPIRGPVDLADLPRNFEDSRNHESWEVCRATTAAPFYFKPIVIGDDEYSEGGTEANNSTMETIGEMRMLHKDSSKLFASFGTGKVFKESTFMKKTQNHPYLLRATERARAVVNRAKAALVDCQDIHEYIVELLKHGNNGIEYHRFNVEKGLGEMKLNEWKLARDHGRGGRCSSLRYIQLCTEAELAKDQYKKS